MTRNKKTVTGESILLVSLLVSFHGIHIYIQSSSLKEFVYKMQCNFILSCFN